VINQSTNDDSILRERETEGKSSVGVFGREMTIKVVQLDTSLSFTAAPGLAVGREVDPSLLLRAFACDSVFMKIERKPARARRNDVQRRCCTMHLRRRQRTGCRSCITGIGGYTSVRCALSYNFRGDCSLIRANRTHGNSKSRAKRSNAAASIDLGRNAAVYIDRTGPRSRLKVPATLSISFLRSLVTDPVDLNGPERLIRRTA